MATSIVYSRSSMFDRYASSAFVILDLSIAVFDRGDFLEKKYAELEIFPLQYVTSFFYIYTHYSLNLVA